MVQENLNGRRVSTENKNRRKTLTSESINIILYVDSY